MSTNVAKQFIEQADDRLVVAANVTDAMLENMLQYPGLFVMINRAMITKKRAQIEGPLVAIMSNPMNHSDMDRCVDILSDAGCI